MKYISVEKFLKQSKEIQKAFIDWWQPEFGDLFLENYFDMDSIINVVGCVPINKKHFEDYDGNIHYKTDLVISLLTEGQLRQFIEDKTKCKIELDISSDIGYKGYNLYLRKNWGNDDYEYPYKPFENLSNNLLEAYWQVACQIAEKETNNQKQSIISTNKQGLPIIKGGGKTMREMYNEGYK
ncbi:hypothetical protein [Clostridium rectalis]|uniref:hypothetical protein n=1 Tax=Clostridium rectalis TaxID=2040295 RepID=UPI000F633F21|nr:hypothetical protein [Clostridium rectalis]